MNVIYTSYSQIRASGSSKGCGALFVVCLGFVLLVFTSFVTRDAGSIIDVDDQLRRAQIHQFFEHTGWYDLKIRGVEMPEAYVSPWSRFVDLPYIALALILQPLAGRAQALTIAVHIWPLALLCVVCMLWLGILKRLDRQAQVDRHIPVMAAFLMLMPTVLEFSPGRIDHHNVQMLLLVAALFGFSLRSQVGMAISATACVFSILVGLELAPVVLLIVLAPCCAWILDFEASRRQLLAFAVTTALVAPVAGLVFLGMERMSGDECDAFSAPYLTLLVGYGFISASAAFFVRKTSPTARLMALAVPAVVLVLSVAYRHPVCLGGPYPMVDQVIWDVWIAQIPQERSILQYFAEGNLQQLLLLGLYVLILAGSSISAFERLRSGDILLPTLFIVAAGLLALSFLQLRFGRFSPLLISLFVPLGWERFRRGVRTDLNAIALATFVCACTAAVLTYYAEPFRPRAPTLAHYMAMEECGEKVKGLETLVSGRILLPPALGLALLDQLPPGVSVGALAFHRGGPGMRRFYDVFLSQQSQERHRAAASFDYIALCQPPGALQLPVNSLLEGMQRNGEWPGLIPMFKDQQTGFSLLRIDHPRLR